MHAPETSRPKRLEALAWMLVLGGLFIVAYGGCNRITSARSDVGVVQFEWEKVIPVIPWLVVPYMSIDLFWLAAPFLCSDRRELRTLVRRLAVATLLAAACFLLIPLRLAEFRPEFSGWTGGIHDLLKAFDQPFNLVPSLHIAYLLMLWPLYHAHTRGGARVAMHAWFSLVFLSVLPVRQHHAIDVLSGAALAVVMMYVFPDPRREHAPDQSTARHHPRKDIALRYALGAALAAGLIPFIGWWGILAAWIAMSLFVMACAYAFAGPAVYRKCEGHIPIPTRILLAPHMLGLYVTRLYWFRKSAPYDCVVDHVLLGRLLNSREAAALSTRGAVATLDLTAEHAESDLLRRQTYVNLPILDLTAPTVAQLAAATAFINVQSRRGSVYVHCGLGYGRSAAVVAAWLMASGRAEGVQQACDIVLRARPGVVFTRHLIDALRDYQQSLPIQSARHFAAPARP